MPKFQQGNTFSKGRPKGSGYVDRCKKWAEKKGWNILERLAEGKRPLDPKALKQAVKEEGSGNVANDLPENRLRYHAARTLIEYGFGKPKQVLEVEGEDGKPTIFGILADVYNASQSSEGSTRPRSKRA